MKSKALIFFSSLGCVVSRETYEDISKDLKVLAQMSPAQEMLGHFADNCTGRSQGSNAGMGHTLGSALTSEKKKFGTHT
jgi:hypothetical protein